MDFTYRSLLNTLGSEDGACCGKTAAMDDIFGLREHSNAKQRGVA